MNEQLITIDALVLLFWDYRTEDINELKKRSDDFEYVWNEYVEGRDRERWPQTYHLLWELWLTKFSNRTKRVLIKYALERFGDEKRRGLEQADMFDKMMKAHIAKQEGK